MSQEGPARSRSGPLLVAGLALTVVVVGLLARDRGGSDRALDPRSHQPPGTSALVALLRELGAEVRLDRRAVRPDDDVAVVLWDRLDDRGRDDLTDWVRAGGTLVVADPRSPLAPSFASGLFDFVDPEGAGPGRCDVEELAGLGEIAPGDPSGLEVGEGDRSCYGNGDVAFVVARTEGAGRVLAVASPGFLTNGALAEADNAPLAAELVAPRGDERVAFVTLAPAVGGGDRSLVDLVPDGVRRALAQLGVAFAAYALWRAVRLGRPVVEDQPVAVAGSELTEATGRLLARGGQPGPVADLVRHDLRSAVVRRLGIPATVGPSRLVAAVVERTGLDEATVRAGLGEDPVADDAQLLAVTLAAARIRQETLT
ncbi:MAG: DUF4350 domain-containing protein [Acidimicrobiia bacterium]